MKKLLAVALILAMLIPCAVAEAPVDVKSLPDDDLKALYMSVKQELMERKLWDTSVLPAGVYQAGTNLPEGTYECTVRGKDTFVVIHKNMEQFIKGTNINFYRLQEGESFVMSLYGEIVYDINKECTVRPFVGLNW